MGAYENQHYIPRSYLKHFAHNSMVMVRPRGAPPYSAAIKNVASERHLYSLSLPDGTHDTSAEHTLANFEAAAAQSLGRLRRGGPVPDRGTDERHGISLFLALQMVRTPEGANQWLFATSIVERTGTTHPSLDEVRAHLREHLDFEPSVADVKGAHDFVEAARAIGLPTKAERLSIMFEVAMQFAPLLEAMNWSVEECAAGHFITCDRLPAIWRPPSPEDRYQGVGIEDAEELWLPLDPRTLLVLRPGGPESRSNFGPERAHFVNRYLARHCYRAVFHDPRFAVAGDTLPMNDRRLTLRFVGGPIVDDRGPTGSDAIHLWTPVRDDAWAASSTVESE